MATTPQPSGARPQPNYRGTWQEREKQFVNRVLNAIPEADWGVLKDLALVRVDHMPEADDPVGDEAPQPVPEVETVPSARPRETWHTVAHFHHRISNIRVGVTEVKELMISNGALKALDDEAAQFVAHEIGHAVEKQRYKQLDRAVCDAYHEYRKLYDVYTKAVGEENAESSTLEPLRTQRAALVDQHTQAHRLKDEAWARYDTAFQGAKGVVAAYNTAATAEDQKKLKPDLDTAKAKSLQAEKAYEDEVAKVGDKLKRIEAFDAQKYDPAALKVKGKTAVRVAAQEKQAQARERMAAARLEVATAYDATRTQTHRARNLADEVARKGIRPDLTPYAAKEWANGPEELYAEAYGYFVLSPEKLKKHSADLYAFFATGHYRKDSL
jgi:hypothetical protein